MIGGVADRCNSVQMVDVEPTPAVQSVGRIRKTTTDRADPRPTGGGILHEVGVRLAQLQIGRHGV
jgi:hypothetical protein